ncbi:hypothetical protein B296_00026634, partial [Ensete ventricosum]
SFSLVCQIQGVRREVGSHAKILNKIPSSQEEDDIQSPSPRSSSVNCEKMSPFASISDKSESYGPNSESYSFRGPGITSTKVDMPSPKVNVKVPLPTKHSDYYPLLNESVGHTEVQVLVGAILGLIVSAAVDVIL